MNSCKFNCIISPDWIKILKNFFQFWVCFKIVFQQQTSNLQQYKFRNFTLSLWRHFPAKNAKNKKSKTIETFAIKDLLLFQIWSESDEYSHSNFSTKKVGPIWINNFPAWEGNFNGKNRNATKSPWTYATFWLKISKHTVFCTWSRSEKGTKPQQVALVRS